MVHQLLLSLSQYSSSIRNAVLSVAIDRFHSNRPDFEYMAGRLKEHFDKEYEAYPSIFNNGYLHIDKAIKLASYLKLPSDNGIIDAGAANGATSILFSKAFPAAKVYAFEPIPVTYRSLQDNIAGMSHIVPFHLALGSQSGEVSMHIAKRVSSSSLLPIEQDLKNEFWASNLKEESSVTVKVSRLDDEIPSDKKINILKMDVQGYEFEILKGGIQTLQRTAIVLVEMQNHDLYINAPKYYDIDLFLREHNFELYDCIPSLRQENKLFEWDSIYVNKRALK